MPPARPNDTAVSAHDTQIHFYPFLLTRHYAEGIPEGRSQGSGSLYSPAPWNRQKKTCILKGCQRRPLHPQSAPPQGAAVYACTTAGRGRRKAIPNPANSNHTAYSHGKLAAPRSAPPRRLCSRHKSPLLDLLRNIPPPQPPLATISTFLEPTFKKPIPTSSLVSPAQRATPTP